MTKTIRQQVDQQTRSTETFVDRIVRLVEEKKGENTVVLDVSDAPIIIDTFVVSEANSAKQLRAIARHLKESIEKPPYAMEGLDSRTWAVLDYGAVVVHILEREAREFYDLEGLWEFETDA